MSPPLRFGDNVGSVARLLVEQVHGVRCAGRVLVTPQEQEIGEPVGRDAVEGANAILPMQAERHAVTSDWIEAGQAGVGNPGLEAGGEDDAIDLVFLVADDNTEFGEFLDAAPLGIDELDIGRVERFEVIVMEAGTLAQPAIVGLQCLGGRRVLDDLLDPGADSIHHPVVGELGDTALLVRGGRAPEPFGHLLGRQKRLHAA